MLDNVEVRRGIVVGDIHGCANAFSVMLKNLDLTANDFLVVLGDAVDRGPDTRGVLDQLLEIRKACEVIYIQGNHEEMMLAALKGHNRDRWLIHGGKETLNSYGGDEQDIPQRHWELLNSTVRYWEGQNEICVHANLEPGVPLGRQRSSWLRWNKLTGKEFPHPSGKLVICGHSGVGYGAPRFFDGWLCLDTLAYGGGVLSALDLKSGEIIQTRDSNGELRRGVFLNEL